MRPNLILCLILMAGCFVGTGLQAAGEMVFRETFADLAGWEPLFFSGIDTHTEYQVSSQEGLPVLMATSRGGASALVCTTVFDVNTAPIIRWRWKVDKVYAGGDYRSKSGDDYPLRVYVLFAFDPESASLATKIKYEAVRALYGRYPPYRVINYIWANRPEEIDPVASPYTDRSIMVPLRQGPQNAGRWMTETVNVLEDYRRFFGGDPPTRATLAVMNDADNTGEESTSYLQFIEVLKTGE